MAFRPFLRIRPTPGIKTPAQLTRQPNQHFDLHPEFFQSLGVALCNQRQIRNASDDQSVYTQSARGICDFREACLIGISEVKIPQNREITIVNPPKHNPSLRILTANSPQRPTQGAQPRLGQQITEVAQHAATFQAGRIGIQSGIRKKRLQKLTVQFFQSQRPRPLALKPLRDPPLVRQQRPHRLGETRRKHAPLRHSTPNPPPRPCRRNPHLDPAQIEASVLEQNFCHLRSQRV